MPAKACGPQRSKRQRVAPYGSAVATPNAVSNVKRYRCRGGTVLFIELAVGDGRLLLSEEIPP